MNLTDRVELTRLGIPDFLLDEILGAGVRAIMLADNLKSEKAGEMILATFQPIFDVIQIRRNINIKLVSGILAQDTGADILPDEVFLYLLLHEFGHFKKFKENEADLFAIGRVRRMRTEKFGEQWKELGLQIGSAIQNGIAEGIKQAFREVFSPNQP